MYTCPSSFYMYIKFTFFLKKSKIVHNQRDSIWFRDLHINTNLYQFWVVKSLQWVMKAKLETKKNPANFKFNLNCRFWYIQPYYLWVQIDKEHRYPGTSTIYFCLQSYYILCFLLVLAMFDTINSAFSVSLTLFH